jgi:hypothetical protein
MKSISLKSTAPYLAAILIFLLLSIIYMYPVLEGKNIRQNDVVQHQGMSKELIDYRNATGKDALWTNSMFGGMPGYMISTQFNSNKLKYIHRLLVLDNWRPICFVFLYMVGFWIALLAFGVNPWLSIVGAIAYGLSSYFLIIIEVGHISKVLALGYLPPIIGGIHLSFRGKYLWGCLLTGIALGLQIFVVHLQITYYTLLIAFIYGISELVFAIKEKRVIEYTKAIPALLIAVILAIGCNFSSLWTTYEYGKFSTRSKSELTSNKENKTTGLDKDYATQWSYGIGESFTLLIPNFKGGASVGSLPTSSNTYKFLSQPEVMGKIKAKKAIEQMPTYFGKQPGTSGPVYAGAIICFLFILGLFICDDRYRWWLLSATVVSLVFAWGKNVPNLTNFLLDHLPGYNKFRAVSMTMVIAEFTLPLLAMLTLNKVFSGELDKKQLLKGLKYSLGITGGILILFLLFAGSLFDFEAPTDQRYIQQGATDFIEGLKADRLMLLRHDTFRSLVFILLSAGVIFYFINQKIKYNYAVLAMGLLILVDMWPVAKRFLNSDNFVSKKEYTNPITESAADKFILQDKSPDYRVLNISADIFNDATTSYFHKSLGGYHGAKMLRYQELIENCLYDEIQNMVGDLKAAGLNGVDQAMANKGVLNMLNTKYIIYNTEAPPVLNTKALGNAWFVKEVSLAENADDAIQQLKSFAPSKTAVVEKAFSGFVQNKAFNNDSSSSIVLEEYKPNNLKYKTISGSDQLAVFSEIYYPKGWTVTLDGKPADYFRADYVLRAMNIPAGEHTIEFKFHPNSYFIGEKISLASSILFLLLFVGAIAMEIKKSVLIKD